MRTFRTFLLFVTCALVAHFGATAQNAWINEIHYDNVGTDADELIEVVIENPGTYTLSNFSVVLYNGNGGTSYDTQTLDVFTVGATVGNFKFYTFNYTNAGISIQNGAPDGMALAYNGVLITGQFLSYEGTLTATDGPASGVTSVDIGVAESNTTPAGYSLQLAGNGSTYSAFAWQPEAAATPGNLNNNQTLGGTPDPEPTNYPTSFTATPSPFTVNLNWQDATGSQLPDKYLVLGSTQNNITNPADGVPVPDDVNLADGKGALNIAYGVKACQFGNLQSNKPYYFKIFPYTNAGTNINYKTGGTPPSATATTPNSVILTYENFNDTTMGSWIQKSVTGTSTWVLDTIHGIAGTPCAKMSGFAGSAAAQNEDWLISPSMNFNLYDDEELTFQTAVNYTGPALEPLISNNYNGTGDPNTATWVPLTGTLSAGSWAWTPSGAIDLSGTSGTGVRVAFKYTSTNDEAATWEVDEILVTGTLLVGVPQVSGTKRITVGPNPSQGQFRVVFGDDLQKEVQVTSAMGKEVFKTNTNQASIEVSIRDLASGLYFVKVTYPGSSTVISEKIIIQ